MLRLWRWNSLLRSSSRRLVANIDAMQRSLTHVIQLARICKTLGVVKAIKVCPLLAFHAPSGLLPGGIIFSARSQTRRSREMYAVGGR